MKKIQTVIEEQFEVLNPEAGDYENYVQFGELIIENLLNSIIEEMEQFKIPYPDYDTFQHEMSVDRKVVPNE